MSDIIRTSVLTAFVEHGKISIQEFESKNIFHNYYGGTDRAHFLDDILRNLVDEQILLRIKEVPGPSWKLLNFNRATKETAQADSGQNAHSF